MIGKSTCPICNKQCVNLLAHMKKHNKKYVSKEDVLKDYPELKDTIFQHNTTISVPTVCPICNKTYKSKQAVKVHIKAKHKEYYDEHYIESKKHSVEGQECKICYNTVYDLKQHIEIKHQISWKDYCDKHKHPLNLTKIVKQDYKDKLSQNKKEFYKSEQGLKLRQIQSELFKNNNPSHNSDCVQKQILGRIKTISKNSLDAFRSSNYGIKCKYKNMCFRSFTEFSVFVWAELNNIELLFEHSKNVFYWTDNKVNILRNYIPDFFYNNLYFEVKSSKNEVKKAIKAEKYILSRNVIKNAGYDLVICTANDLFKTIGIPEMNTKIIIDKVKSLYLNKEVEFYCNANSRIIKTIVGSNNLKNISGVYINGNN